MLFSFNYYYYFINLLSLFKSLILSYLTFINIINHHVIFLTRLIYLNLYFAQYYYDDFHHDDDGHELQLNREH
jgi:hypothetical protein